VAESLPSKREAKFKAQYHQKRKRRWEPPQWDRERALFRGKDLATLSVEKQAGNQDDRSTGSFSRLGESELGSRFGQESIHSQRNRGKHGVVIPRFGVLTPLGAHGGEGPEGLLWMGRYCFLRGRPGQSWLLNYHPVHFEMHCSFHVIYFTVTFCKDCLLITEKFMK
jgi:hypothetical protein